jgi:23S rRNA pseudouridine2457 synthase
MKRYFIFYKPYNVLCQFSAEGEKITLSEFLSLIPKNIYPVGRLDYDSEGLLLLTNDTQLNHQLLDPAFKHPRTYLVQVEGIMDEDALKQLEQGVVINVNGEKYKTRPAKAEKIIGAPKVPERNPPIRFRKNIPTSWIYVTLTEGKNRQVRKMTAAVGYPTLRLIRYRIGQLELNELAPGQYKEISLQELMQLLAL